MSEWAILDNYGMLLIIDMSHTSLSFFIQAKNSNYLDNLKLCENQRKKIYEHTLKIMILLKLLILLKLSNTSVLYNTCRLYIKFKNTTYQMLNKC